MKPRPTALALLLVALLASAGGAQAQTTSRYVYDAAGRLVLAQQGDGTLVTYDYDAAGNLIKVGVLRPGDTEGDVTGIHPDAMSPATETIVTIFGVGLGPTSAVSFDAPGITASIQGTPTHTAITLAVRVDATAAPGAHGFTLHRTFLPSIASGDVVLHVRPVPTLVAVRPSRLLTGQTVESFTLTGARLDRAPNVIFSRPGLTLLESHCGARRNLADRSTAGAAHDGGRPRGRDGDHVRRHYRQRVRCRSIAACPVSPAATSPTRSRSMRTVFQSCRRRRRRSFAATPRCSSGRRPNSGSARVSSGT